MRGVGLGMMRHRVKTGPAKGGEGGGGGGGCTTQVTGRVWALPGLGLA